MKISPVMPKMGNYYPKKVSFGFRNDPFEMRREQERKEEGIRLAKSLPPKEERVRDAKNKFRNVDYETDTGTILSTFGIEYENDSDGALIVTDYRQPYPDTTFRELSIDENKMFEHIKGIKGDLKGSKDLKYLNRLEFVDGNLDFENSESIRDFGNLKTVTGDLDVHSTCNLKSLGKLQKVGGNLRATFSFIEDTGDLFDVGGSANFCYSKLKRTKLQYAGKLNVKNTPIEDLDYVLFVEGDLDISGTKLKMEDAERIKVFGKIIATDMISSN